jgi:mannose-6-phosphate isomerase-like protein (cupin superfamily)
MKKIQNKINHKDKRGVIIDLLQKEKINSITYITIRKGAVRGNHYHKKTHQWNYIISGKMKLISRKNNIKKIAVLKKNDLYLSEPMEHHALVGITKCEVLVFTRGPRGGKEYESDTFRIEDKLA